MTVAANAQAFIEAVKNGETGNSLQRRLLVSTVEELTSWTDAGGFDVLHHSIALNSAEAVQLLLTKDYFVRPYIPQCNLYAHVAAKLGFHAILCIILEHRPDDFRTVSGSISLPGKVNDEKLDDSVERSPLDIAAQYKHIGCVRVLLNQCILRRNPEITETDDVTLACLANCPASLKLILNNGPGDIKSGIELTLKKAQPECLDLLLKHNVQPSSVFDGMNFYHVLYTYSATFSKEAMPMLPVVTSILLKHGHSVTACSPPRTYPLYSLLSHSFCIDDYTNTKYYIECMKMLLTKGADPCFDEVKDEARQVTRGVKVVEGRNVFSSALHCLLDTVEVYASFLDSRILAVRFVEVCADILINFNCPKCASSAPRGVGNLVTSILDQYARSSVVIGVNRVIMKCMLRYGADPNEKVDGNYAVNTYVDVLFGKMSSLEVLDTSQKYKEEIDAMLKICVYMSLTSIRECAAIFKKKHSYVTSEQVKPYVKYIQEELDKRCHVIRSLRRLSAWAMWNVCRRKPSVVHSLPVTAQLKTDILPIE